MGNDHINNISPERNFLWIQGSDKGLSTEAKAKARLNFFIINPIPSTEYQISLFTLSLTYNSTLIGKTTSITATSKETLHFLEFFTLQYFFEKEQKIKIEIRINNHSHSIQTTLGNIMGSRKQLYIESFGTNNEKLKVCGDSLTEDIADIEFKVKARCNKSLYFLIKSFGTTDQNIVMPLYKSEVIRPIFEQSFEVVKIPYMFIGNSNDFSRFSIAFEVYDFKSRKKIGERIGTLNTFLRKDNNVTLNTSKEYVFQFECEYLRKYSFLDFLRGGMQVSLIFAIDFTSSNGEITNPSSLHYISQVHYNDYESAIEECGKIVAHYDYDQLFPIYGYGAKLNENGDVNHCFPLTFTNDPYVQGIEGVLNEYRKALPRIILHGPTNFAPILKKINDEVNEQVKKGNHIIYHIIMFLTDGQICDIDNTIDELVEASFLPISVIIIGIGNGDFKSMDILDADENPLFDRNGRKAARDLVQFVPYNNFRHDKKRLPEEVLEEVPRQVMEYYQMNRISPGDPIMQITVREEM